jgi:hypothetical protein
MLNPEDAGALHYLSTFLKAQNSHGGAEAMNRKAIELDPEHTESKVAPHGPGQARQGGGHVPQGDCA